MVSQQAYVIETLERFIWQHPERLDGLGIQPDDVREALLGIGDSKHIEELEEELEDLRDRLDSIRREVW